MDSGGGRDGGPRPSARRGCAACTAQRHHRRPAGRCWLSGCPRPGRTGAGPNDKNPPAARTKAARPAPGPGGSGAVPRRADHQDPSAGGPPLPPAGTGDHRGAAPRQPGVQPLMDRLRIARRGTGRPRTRPGRLLGDKAYSNKKIRAPPAATPTSRPPSPNRPTRSPTGADGASAAGGRLASMRVATKHRNTMERAFNKLQGQFRAVAMRTTSATTSTGAPLTSPRSRSGSATPSTKIHETRPSRPPSQPVVHPHDRSRPADHPDSLSLARGSALRR